ncbi:hypothetical protein M0R04_10110 [Candidatus Dojkabacteria bacterium]|jgi:hypothetical protein|nr:hypothetical protein [Candidatus Dojkabacteria bacterium]
MNNLDNIQITTECIKSVKNIGGTTYINVCNGNISTIPWGHFQYIGVGLLLIFATVVVYTIYSIWNQK